MINGANIKSFGILGGVVNSVLSSEHVFVGGVVGAAYSSTISDCFNSATVGGGSSRSIGGILGSARGGTVTIQNSLNLGVVSGEHWIGGIVGSNYDANVTLNITRSFNAGKITATTGGVGGILGAGTDATSITNLIEDCYNTGDLVGGSARGAGGATGGCCSGGTARMTISRFYSVGAVSGLTIGNIWGVDSYVGVSSFSNIFWNTSKSPNRANGASRTSGLTNVVGVTQANMLADNTLTSSMSGLGTTNWYKRPNESTADQTKMYYPELKVFTESNWYALRHYSKASVTVSGPVDPGYKNNMPPEYTDPGTIDLGYIGQADTVINTATISARDINDPIRTFQWVSPSVVSGGSH